MITTRHSWAHRRQLSVVVVALFVASTVALVVHEEPRPPSAPPAPPAPAPVGQTLSAQALEDLAAAGVIPGAPSARVAPEGNRVPAAGASTAPNEAKPAPSAPVGPSLGPAVGLDAYRGMGTWVDVYDWTHTYTRGRPHVGPGDVDRMATLGVRTLYIQASKHDAPTDVLEPELLRQWIDRARGRGIRVVAWYLPTLVDPARDLQRMVAVAGLPVDSVAVDIESKDVRNLAERNRRLVDYSARLRQALPGRVIGAIVLPPVVLEVVNPLYWPSFPYQELLPSYDVWLTMGYWTNRRANTPYRNAHRYTRENVSRLRANLGRPDAVVHAIGGIGDRTTVADVVGYRLAALETGSIGGSLYDWRTTGTELWIAMQAFRI